MIQMKTIQAFVGIIEAEKAKRRITERLNQRRTMMAIEKDKANKVEEEARRQTEIKKQADSFLLVVQKRQRRERVKRNLIALDELFESRWVIKEMEMLSAGNAEIDSWMKSAEFQDLRLKKEAELMRSISLGSGFRNNQEIAISNRAAIAYSIIDGYLTGANTCADEFLHHFRSNTVSFEEFQTALDTCQVTIETTQLKSLFGDLCSASPNSPNVVCVKEVNKCRQLSQQYIAPEGAPWKMYIEPFEQKLLFHCVLTNEKIFESDMTKKQIKRITRDNSGSIQMKLRKEVFRQKCKARELMLQHYAARQIQYMYRKWKSKCRIKRRWICFDEYSCQLTSEDCVTLAIASISSAASDWSSIKMI